MRHTTVASTYRDGVPTGFLDDPRRALRTTSVAVAAVWLPVLVLWGPLPHTITFDDAWYYFGIARNVAEGRGSSFDGLNATNGYHPLWLLVCTVFSAVGLDDLAAVRAILVAQLALWAAALWVLADTASRTGWTRLADRPDATTTRRRCTVLVSIVWFLVAANPYVLKLFVNGMESGLVALLGALVLALAVRTDGNPLERPVPLAVLLCLSFLARTDAVLWIGVLIAWLAVRNRGIDRRLVGVVAALAVTGSAYLVSNLIIVGHPMQISGEVKRVPLDGPKAVVLALCVLATVGIAVAGFRAARTPSAQFPRTKAWFARTAWYPAGLVLLTAYDLVLTSEVYLWHFAPQMLWIAATLLHAASDMAESAVVERPLDDPSAAWRPVAVSSVFIIPLLLGGLYQVRSFTDREQVSAQIGDRAAGEWIDANLPADAVVGSFDAGALGYFAGRPVINLDGLVNSYEWNEARDQGTEATAAFLRDAGITHLANHGDVVDGDDPEMRDLADGLLGRGVGERLTLVHTDDYVFAGTAGSVSGARPYATFVFAIAPEDR
ncbi:MAG: hypothetical protein JWO77_1534 [Ilumatobacteraceae bacterium]|nr:hypothetical protein [Ilumatobacteraceae bacterium]